MRLKDKVALITGGAGELGFAIAEEYLRQGAAVVLFDADGGLLRDAAEKLAAAASVSIAAGDVRNLADLDKAVALAQARHGGLDILVTCAGVLKHRPIEETTMADWDRVVGVNLTGTFAACKAAVPALKTRKGGRIITISSVGGRTGRPHVGVDYAASKGGVVGLTMLLAKELGAFGITVNSIAPGPIAGRMLNQLPPEKIKALISTACIGRLGSPRDIAAAATFLASDDAEWITGEVLDVNGGVYI
jgi:NAD(P)-dependent dehydrogenase (short-subunit alcohol dehydrogenase family)